jgi:20S proteasome subunit alpha 2
MFRYRTKKCGLVLLFLFQFSESNDRSRGRYSYSLTTFDPSGKLGQVERAIEAAEQGTPIVALIYNNGGMNKNSSGIILAAPQVLPDLLTLDDGTTRFSLVTPEIMITHTGLSGDGRILVAAAQRLAVQHQYTFDEYIDITIFLEELSLLFQEYTMKAASRPFGASIVVAFVPQSKLMLYPNPVLYRIDPSGNVESLGNCSVVHGKLDKTDLLPNLNLLLEPEESSVLSLSLSIEDTQTKMVKLLRDALRQQAAKKRDETFDDLAILTAILSGDDAHGGVFRTERHEPDTTATSPD